MKSDWKALPCEGGTFCGLRFVGNGKDSELVILTEEHPPIVAPLSGARWEMRSEIPLVTEMHAHGDAEIVTELRPAAGAHGRLSEARACDWTDQVELSTRTVHARIELDTCVMARLVITRG